MRVSAAILLLGFFVWLACPALAQAGMPTVTLSDIARMRLQSISFFLVGFLIAAGFIQLLWNGLRKDFAFLPRLSYVKSLIVVGLWGLLFVLVLTMISGARELMTPGAWEKQGLTYKLPTEPELDTEADDLDKRRYEKLIHLWKELSTFAAKHDGQFPVATSAIDIPKDKWQVPGPAPMSYRYAGGAMSMEKPAPLVYEPDVFGAKRYVLFSNGIIEQMAAEELIAALPAEK